MGGQFKYWGLWLDSEYGIGECSESCTTYKNYIQLAATKNFKIRNIEVWGVGDKPAKEDEVRTCCTIDLDLNNANIIHKLG